jgi:hypothetical protein
VHGLLNIPLEVRWSTSDIIGVGVGVKTTEGKTSRRPVLTVLVRAKLSPELLRPFHISTFLKHWKELREKISAKHWKQRCPEREHWTQLREENIELWKELGKDDIDVIETGTLTSVEGLAGPVNRLTIGADVAMAGRATHGTVCGFAKLDDCNQPFLLSCGHVLDSRGGKFHLVTSRGEVVAKICKQAVLLPGHGMPPYRAQQDAVLLNNVEPSFELPDHRGRLSSHIPEQARCGMCVTKVGKSVTEGHIRYLNVDVLIDYPSQISWLRDQILVKSDEQEGRSFAQAGDSGALVITRVDDKGHHGKSQLLPVGMVIAAGDPATLIPKGKTIPPQYTVVSPMKAVLEALEAELLVG